MVENLQKWRDLWGQDAKPKDEEIAKRDIDVQKIVDQVEALRVRKPMTTMRITISNTRSNHSRTSANSRNSWRTSGASPSSMQRARSERVRSVTSSNRQISPGSRPASPAGRASSLNDLREKK